MVRHHPSCIFKQINAKIIHLALFNSSNSCIHLFFHIIQHYIFNRYLSKINQAALLDQAEKDIFISEIYKKEFV